MNHQAIETMIKDGADTERVEAAIDSAETAMVEAVLVGEESSLTDMMIARLRGLLHERDHTDDATETRADMDRENY